MNELENQIDAAMERDLREEEKKVEAAERSLISISISPQAYTAIVNTMDSASLNTYSEALIFLSSRYLNRR